MEYQNIDEATRREACEKVKKIAETIKKIRKKYYLCFNKISDVDKKRYDELKAQMQNIANQNGLNKFSAELIADLETQFEDDKTEEIQKNGGLSNNSEEDIYQKYLTAINFQAELTVLYRNSTDNELGKLYLIKAIQVQIYINRLKEILEETNSKEKLTEEKRKGLRAKFGEQEKIYFENLLKECYEITSKDPLAQSEASDNIQSYTKNETIEKTMEKSH